MSQIFVSFATADHEVAKEVVRSLEAAGREAWLCTRQQDNAVGGKWAAEIAGALEHAPAVVLLLSQHASASGYVEREVEMAIALHRPLLVVRMDDKPLPPGVNYLLRTLQFLDGTGAPEHWLDDLHRALRRLVGDPVRLPLDSIADREHKVLVLDALFEMLCASGARRGWAMGYAIELDSKRTGNVDAVKRWQAMTLDAAHFFIWSAPNRILRLPILSKEFLLLLPCLVRSGDEGCSDVTSLLLAQRRDAFSLVVRAGLKDCAIIRKTESRDVVFFSDLERYLNDMRRGEPSEATEEKEIAPLPASEQDALLVLERAVAQAAERSPPKHFALPRRLIGAATHEFVREVVAGTAAASAIPEGGYHGR